MFSWANFDDCSVLHQVVLNFSWAQPVQELGSDRRQRNQVSWLPHCHQVHKLQELQKEKGDLHERQQGGEGVLRGELEDQCLASAGRNHMTLN